MIEYRNYASYNEYITHQGSKVNLGTDVNNDGLLKQFLFEFKKMERFIVGFRD